MNNFSTFLLPERRTSGDNCLVQDQTVIQPNLKKCFENMRKLRFDNPDLRITNVFYWIRGSCYGRRFIPREMWRIGWNKSKMRNTLRELISESLEIIKTVERMNIHVVRSDNSLRRSNVLGCSRGEEYHEQHFTRLL